MTTTNDVSIRSPRITRAEGPQTVAGAPTLPAHQRLDAHGHHVATAARAPVSAATQHASRSRAHAHAAHHAHHVLSNSVLRVGSHGAAVKELQKQLNHHGAHLHADGAFGPATESAVKAFQHANHLGADGVVGPKTHKALISPHAHNIQHVTHHGGADTSTVAGCARALLHSPNVTFWTGLSSGSERKNFERLAHGHPSHVYATNKTGPSNVTPSLHLMQALVEMSRHGTIQINALTGGTHSFNSNHYSGHAVDVSVFGATGPDRPFGAHHLAPLSVSEISRIANKHGGVRNSETDHAHIDF